MCRGATEPVSRQLLSLCRRAQCLRALVCALQQAKWPPERVHNWSVALLPAAAEKPAQRQRPSTARNETHKTCTRYRWSCLFFQHIIHSAITSTIQSHRVFEVEDNALIFLFTLILAQCLFIINTQKLVQLNPQIDLL